MTPATHPIDTDARERRVTEGTLQNILARAEKDYAAGDASTMQMIALDQRDELDRLRAAEAAGKARVELSAVAEAIHCARHVPGGIPYRPLAESCQSDREYADRLGRSVLDLANDAARAEIARLTDAGAVATSVGIVPVHTDYSVYPNKTIFALAETNAFVGNALRREAFREAARVAETYKFGLTQMGDARAAAIATKLYALAEESKP